jgi:hypothetical protein
LLVICDLMAAKAETAAAAAVPAVLQLALQLQHAPCVAQLCSADSVRQQNDAAAMMQLLQTALHSNPSAASHSFSSQADCDDLAACLAAVCCMPAALALPAAAVTALLELAVQLQVCSAAVEVLWGLPGVETLALEHVKQLMKVLQGPAAVGAPRSLLTWLASRPTWAAEPEAAANLVVEQLQAAAAMNDVAAVRALCRSRAALALPEDRVTAMFVWMYDNLGQRLEERYHGAGQQQQQGEQGEQASSMCSGHLTNGNTLLQMFEAVLALPKANIIDAAQLAATLAARKQWGYITILFLLPGLHHTSTAAAAPATPRSSWHAASPGS